MEFQHQHLQEVLHQVVEVQLEIDKMEQHLIKLDQIQIVHQTEDYKVAVEVEVLDLILLLMLMRVVMMEQLTPVVEVEVHQETHLVDMEKVALEVLV
tara:strand:- start:38 stop:328 length:291 start_codon:yes stop_codon:yes gene_type:complete